MSRRIQLALIFAVLTVVIASAIVVVSAQGQATAPTVKGFPFAQVGKSYEVVGYHSVITITKDLGNSWVEAKALLGDRPVFVNLNQVTVLVPRN